MSKEGVDATAVEYDGSPQALDALRKGEVDMAQVNIAPAIEDVARGAGLRVVWGNIHGNPLNPPPPSPDSEEMVMALISSPSLSKAADLKGARIGISMKGATNHFAVVPYL